MACAIAGAVAAAAAMGGLDWTAASTYDDAGEFVPEVCCGVLVGDGFSKDEKSTPDDVRCIDGESGERAGSGDDGGCKVYLKEEGR